MRRGLRVGALVVGALLAVGLLGLALGAIVRSRVSAAAARYQLEVSVGAVRPGWLALRLTDVVLRPVGVDGVTAHAREVRLGPSREHRLEVHDLSVVVVGDADVLRRQAEVWRQSLRVKEPASEPTKSGSETSPGVQVDGLSIAWVDREGALPRLLVEDAAATFDGTTVRATAGSSSFRSGRGLLSLEHTRFSTNRAGDLLELYAESASVALAPPATSNAPAPAPATTPVSSSLSALPRLGDLRSVWTIAHALGQRLTGPVAVGTTLRIDAFTWKVPPAVGVPLTVGPGPLTLQRSPSAFDVRFSTGHEASGTPLSLQGTLATDDGEDVLSLEGGPIALSTLGVQEGAAGLVDVARTTMTGRVRVVLADSGATLTFAGEGGVTGLSIADSRIAQDVVRGLALSFHAHGEASAEGKVRFDDFGASMGAARIELGGRLEEGLDDALVGSIHFEVPSTSCQTLATSLPGALLPALEGTEMAGTFAARGRVEFDSRSLDQMVLEYDVRDLCRMARVPAQLARARFQHSFVHQVYQPDGSIEDSTTGPGTDEWTPIEDISPYMPIAVMTTEDAAFMSHHGFSRVSIRSSIIANLKARRFVRGASTITMQLAKNLFLVRDKTISRKLEEVVLTDYLEQTFSKQELMELYLNVIEFGPGIYGVGDAADYYFGRTPAELDLTECLFLASLLPAPVRYGAMREAGQVPESWMRVIRSLLATARRNGRITDAELADAEKQTIVFWQGGDRPTPRAPVRSRPGLEGAPEPTTAPSDSPDGP
jgi:hypothetical protein